MLKHHWLKLILLLAVEAIALSACAKTLNVSEVEQNIQTKLSQQAKLSIKAVSCPQDIKLEQGKEFDCVAALNPEGGFFIKVKQEDNLGTVSWDIPHSWRLLNLSKLETQVQAVLHSTNSKISKVNCGGIYRPVQPGDSFECRLSQNYPNSTQTENKANVAQAKGGPIDRAQTSSATPGTILSDAVIVNVKPQGEITWQEVREVLAKPAVPAKALGVASSSSQPLSTDSSNSATSAAEDPSGWTELAD